MRGRPGGPTRCGPRYGGGGDAGDGFAQAGQAPGQPQAISLQPKEQEPITGAGNMRGSDVCSPAQPVLWRLLRWQQLRRCDGVG